MKGALRLVVAAAASVPLIAAADPQAPTAAVPMSAIWWVPLVAAFIGAVSAIATTVLKEHVFQRRTENRSKVNEQKRVFRNYAAPLAVTSEKLIWRFSEIFVEGRHHFLKRVTLPLVYNEYKRTSTLYRIGCLLGWIRAINLELSALPRGASDVTGALGPVSVAIAQVQSALADGPHVELHRLEQICSVWRITSDADAAGSEENKKLLATKLEIKLYSLAGDKLKHDSEYLKRLPEEEKIQICRGVSDFLCSELKRAPIAEEIIRESLNTAVAALSYREALIYRDWQDAIGDAMLEKDHDSLRRFKVIGYEKFDQILQTPSLWMEVFRDSIADIDFDSMDPNDFRAKQLKDLSSGVAGIMLALSKTEDRDLVSPPVLKIASRLSAAA